MAKVKFIGALDMLKFKNMAKTREKHIQAAPAKEVIGEFSINSSARALHPDFINVKVAEITDMEAQGAKKFVFSPVDGKVLPYFRAGQYISVKLQIGDSFVTRPYSLCSSPKEALEGRYAITIQTKPSGFVSEWVNSNFKVGTELTISSPQGDFCYEPLRDCKNVIAVAGGGGITPFLSMASAIRDGIEDFNLTILNGNRTEDSIFFKKELDEIAAETPKVKVVNVLSDEDKQGFEHGFIDAALIKKYGGSSFSIYVCGPEPMYVYLNGELPKLNMPPRLIRLGAPVVADNVAAYPGFPKDAVGKTFSLTVKQGPNEYKVKASSQETVLVALERAGIKAPSRCRSGVCGWCRSRLVSGKCFIPAETDGRRWADAHGGVIHPCASFPISDLVIDVPGEYC